MIFRRPLRQAQGKAAAGDYIIGIFRLLRKATAKKAMDEINESFKGALVLKPEQKLKEPKMYRVIMHNDHYTTMEFVVEIIIKVFHKSAAEATKIMLDIHKKGMGICGIFTYDIAMTKISEVHDIAKKRQYPLRCSYVEA